MDYIPRRIEPRLRRILQRGKSVLLLGPRQTGKSTLLNRIEHDLLVSFMRPDVRLHHEKEPALLVGEIEALSGAVRLRAGQAGAPAGRAGARGARAEPRGGAQNRRIPTVRLDEVQKVPAILDVVQDLIDRKAARFVLTGSSARKLRRAPEANLLPGRVISLHLDALSSAEYPQLGLDDHLAFGSLPGVVGSPRSKREEELDSYVTTYLEEEVRAEALVRNLGHFARFLELAASESGHVTSLRKLSQEIGVAHTTIASFYQILEDCLIAERIDPLSQSRTRTKLIKTSKYLFFDLGVRRLCAKEGTRPPRERLGFLFEQFVGLELIRRSRQSDEPFRVRFWRDPDGFEVDWIVEREKKLLPIEVKLTDSPSSRDIQPVLTFLAEYPNAEKADVVCRAPRRIQLHKRVQAIPWQELAEIV